MPPLPDSLWAAASRAMECPDLRQGLERMLSLWQLEQSQCPYGILVRTTRQVFLHVYASSDSQRRQLEQALLQRFLSEEDDDLPEPLSLDLPVEANSEAIEAGNEHALPLRCGEREVGFLLIATPDSSTPLGPATDWAQALALLVQHFERLSEASSRDYLTGLSNRAHFDEFLQRALELHQRHQLPLGLGLLDVNQFKAINDSLGHNGGDALLRDLAHALSGTVRDSDMLARYGGDEFAILLLNTEAGDCLRAIQRIEAHMRSCFPEGPTFGGGWVHLGAEAATPEASSLIQRADEALYACKAKRPTEAWKLTHL